MTRKGPTMSKDVVSPSEVVTKAILLVQRHFYFNQADGGDLYCRVTQLQEEIIEYWVLPDKGWNIVLSR